MSFLSFGEIMSSLLVVFLGPRLASNELISTCVLLISSHPTDNGTPFDEHAGLSPRIIGSSMISKLVNLTLDDEGSIVLAP